MFSGSVILLFVFLAFSIQLNVGQLTFFVVGDWGGSEGSSTSLQKDVAAAMVQVGKQTPPSFILTVGDNFYENGVTSVTDPLWQSIYEKIYKNPLLQVPWYPVLGNRDHYGNISAQNDYTNYSNRWYFPQRNYQLVKSIPNNNGTVHFIMLDSYDMATSITPESTDTTEPPKINQDKRNENSAFVLTAFHDSTSLWKVLVTHYPMYSAGSHGPILEEFQPQLAPLLVDVYPDVYFAGHDHSLQHLYNSPIHCYIVGGSGTKTSNTWVPDNEVIGVLYYPQNPNQVPPQTGGFVSVTVTDAEMVVTIYSRYGGVLHNYTHYPQTPPDQPPTSTPPSSTPPPSTPTTSPGTSGTSSGNQIEWQGAANTPISIYEIGFALIGGFLMIVIIVLVLVYVKGRGFENV